MTKTVVLVLLLGMLIATATPVVNAAKVGLSGQCYGAYQNERTVGPRGGGDKAEVDTDNPDANQVLPKTRADLEKTATAGTATEQGEGQGAAEGVIRFAKGTVEDGGQTGKACDRYDCVDPPNPGPGETCAENGKSQRYDYLEVHAEAGPANRQVCYNAQVFVTGKDPTTGEYACVTSTQGRGIDQYDCNNGVDDDGDGLTDVDDPQCPADLDGDGVPDSPGFEQPPPPQ